MGFDTIEINLILQISFHVNLMKTVVNSNKMMQKICFWCLYKNSFLYLKTSYTIFTGL